MAANTRAAVELVFGGGSVSGSSPFGDISTLGQALDLLKEEGVNRIDTAHLYGDSEDILGTAEAGKHFTIDSKIKGGFEPGSAKAHRVLEGVNLSLKRLKSEDVEAIYNHCKDNGYPPPSAYQGNYSAVARKLETDLLPVLRKLGISFYVYSPMAGGFLTKTKGQMLEGAGRFNESAPGGSMYTKMYKKPLYLDALETWNSIADTEGCTKASLAYRWVLYNSQLSSEYGDGVLLGASSLEQLEQTLDNLKQGLLSEDAAKRIDEMWKSLKSEAPTDNFRL